MPAKNRPKRRNGAPRQWARYRAERAAAQERGEAILKGAEFAKGKDRLWSVKSEIAGRKIRKSGFRTKAGARLWLRDRSQAFVAAQKAKALSLLSPRDRAIARALDVPE